jgi:hypothetical protein
LVTLLVDHRATLTQSLVQVADVALFSVLMLCFMDFFPYEDMIFQSLCFKKMYNLN